MTGVTYSTSNVFFLPLITSISITNAYNFTLDSFLRLLAMLNLVQKKVIRMKPICLEAHILTLFVDLYNLHHNFLPCLGNCKNLLSQVMFH